MKSIIKMLGVVVMTMPSFGAIAQQFPRETGIQNGQHYQPGFVDAKKKIAQRIQERIGKMEKRLGCVRNAQDTNALHACFPIHMERTQDHSGNGQVSEFGDGDDDDDDDD